MLATSMRQPSNEYGGLSHFATTESGPSMKRRRSSAEFQLNFGSDRVPSQYTYSVCSAFSK